MKAETPITLAAAKYASRVLAVEDFERVWSARGNGEFDHTAVAVLTKDSDGKLKIDRHDSTTKHLAWLGAGLAVLAPGVGVAVGVGAGAIVGHFHHNIQVREAGTLLDSGEAGLIAVNKQGTDIEPLLLNAEKTSVRKPPRATCRLRSTRNWQQPNQAMPRAERSHIARATPVQRGMPGHSSVQDLPRGSSVVNDWLLRSTKRRPRP